MSQADLHFQVDSRLATLLSQEYPSSERALKELIDNAWDADAEQVRVTLPKPLSDAPIIISDDGSGMTEEELRRHYLSIATDRRSRRGDRTVGKNRLIKGRKGIGKFAGLMAASIMTLETQARGRLCGFTLGLGDLAKHIADSRPRDIASIAEGLNDFGLAEMAYVVEQANARSTFLDQLEQLALNAATSEANMHKALERNLWVFGPEFTLFSTNTTLKRQIEEYLKKEYVGKKADQRPDLVLNQNLSGEHLLIEFKRPSHSLDHDDYIQAIAYRHELGKYIRSTIRVLLIGGRRSPDFPQDNREPQVNVVVFDQLIATARKQLQWLLRDNAGFGPTQC